MSDSYQDEINNLIEEAYEETVFGGPDKIFKYLNQYHKEAQITRADIKEYLDNQQQEQILKLQKPPKALGHIVASFPFEIVQIDIYDLSKYEKYNKGYKYLMAFIDVFTRFGVPVPMKTKSIDDTTRALNYYIKITKHTPKILMSDNDGAFTGDKFQEYLDDKNIILDTNVKGDHFALGIVDNFARRIKLFFSKKNLKLKNKAYTWTDYLPEFITKYNDNPHSALNGLSPSEALDKENFTEIFQLNTIKGLKNKTVSDVEPGDKVRIKISGIFTKSSEPQYSDEVYTVESVNGSTIHLTNGKTYKRYTLLKVPKTTQSNDKNIIKISNEVAKVNRTNKRDDLDTTKIIRAPEGQRSKRSTVKTVDYDETKRRPRK